MRKPESMQPRILLLKNIPRDTHPSQILQHIKFGSIETFFINNESNEASITFFTYLDLYLTVKDLQKENLLQFEIIFNEQMNPNIINAFHCGASRVLLIKDPPNQLDFYKEQAEKFGDLENVVQNEDSIEIRFLNTSSALKLGKYHFANPELKNKVSFGDDPCNRNKKIKSEFLDDSFYSDNRTVYLGGVREDISYSDIFEKIKGGNVFSLKIKRDRKCAFLVFFNVNAANAFIELSLHQDFIVKEYKLKVSRGTETKIPFSNILMIYTGATRALIVSNHDDKITQERIMNDFTKYGEIENINYIENKKIVFVNFISVYEAYNAYFNLRNEAYYKERRVGFGKDRCNNENTEEVMKQVIGLRN
ncbi:hypothetical protein GVAV_002162 [Gurleya vavrai]